MSFEESYEQIDVVADHVAKSYSVLLEGPDATVCAEAPKMPSDSTAYQSEAELEAEFIAQLCRQGYERVCIHTQDELIANLRRQLEALNGFTFADEDWDAFFRTQIANASDGIVEKTRRIQRAPVIDCQMADGTLRNVALVDCKHIHKNRLQVLTHGKQGWTTSAFAGAPAFGTIGIGAVDADESDAVWMTVTDYLTPTTLSLVDIGKEIGRAHV